MSEWNEIKLGDLGTVVTGKTPSKNNPEDWGDNTLFITPSDYGNYRKWADESIRKLSINGVERLSNKVLPIGSILVTCIGSDMGKVVMNRKDAVTNQQINSIIPNIDVINPDFGYYLLVDLYEILRVYGGDGTAVPIVNKGDFEKIDALIPEKEEQNSIAEVLSSLDDKIDLLHRQNQTLEQMAETLFRQWFVNNFDSANYIKLGSLVDTVDNRGKTPPWSEEKTEFPLIEVNALGERLVDYSKIKKYVYEQTFNTWFRAHPKKYDTLLSTVGSIGELSMFIEETGSIAQNVVAFQANGISPFYLYQTLKFFSRDIKEFDIGSVQPSIKVSHLREYEIPVLENSEYLKEFDKFSYDICSKLETNQTQIRTLTALRDTLLPKLMSGDVRVELDPMAKMEKV